MDEDMTPQTKTPFQIGLTAIMWTFALPALLLGFNVMGTYVADLIFLKTHQLEFAEFKRDKERAARLEEIADGMEGRSTIPKSKTEKKEKK